MFDDNTLASILGQGFSRVPIVSHDHTAVNGYLLTKKLIVMDPTLERSLSDLHLVLHKPWYVRPDLDLMTLFQQFQVRTEGREAGGSTRTES